MQANTLIFVVLHLLLLISHFGIELLILVSSLPHAYIYFTLNVTSLLTFSTTIEAGLS